MATKFLKQVIFIIFIVLQSKALVFGQTDWRFLFDKEGIKVYSRTMSGSTIEEFKGVGVINARIEVIGELLRDVPANKNWMKDCLGSKVIEQINRNNMIIHYLIDTPWPVENRDVVFMSETKVDFKQGKVVSQLKAIQDKRVPPQSGYTRITNMQAGFILEYVDREHTRVTYSVKVDPAGSIPSFLSNYANQEIPFETLRGMKRMVTQKKYIEAGSRSPDKTEIENLINEGVLK